MSTLRDTEYRGKVSVQLCRGAETIPAQALPAVCSYRRSKRLEWVNNGRA